MLAPRLSDLYPGVALGSALHSEQESLSGFHVLQLYPMPLLVTQLHLLPSSMGIPCLEWSPHPWT